MVNVPPIPPLLCSTPPPIDFGEDDEDVDVMPSPLDGVENDDFGDFLAEDVISNSDPLPSPTPSAACDLPPISIYDGLMLPDNANITNHITTSPPPPIDDNKANDIKSNLTEAFNFNVIKNKSNETKNGLQNERIDAEKIEEEANVCKTPEILKTEFIKCAPFSPEVIAEYTNQSKISKLNKNANDSNIESVSIEAKCKNKKTDICYKLDMVSIEDIEDDLSDDEAYSPKTPKTFFEPDNLNDYFKIEEINSLNIAGNETKLHYKDVDSKSLDSIDNNEFVSVENENDIELKSLSSNSCIQNKFDMSPPLQGDANTSIEDDDDDFGEFSDFQDIHFVNNNRVPVKDINIKQHKELDDLNKFKQYKVENNLNTTTSASKITNNNVNDTEHQGRLKEPENIKNEFNNLSLSDKFREKMSKQNSLDLQMSQEILNEKIKSPTPADKEFCNEENNFRDFHAMPEINYKDDFQNFAEFADSENINKKAIDNTKEPIKYFKKLSNDDEEFDDFADFESHKVATKSDGTGVSPGEDEEKNNGYNDDDDDDFGDFNTADPVTTASSSTLTTTSQNTTTETPAMPSTNINERISKILQSMFSPTINSVEKSCDEPKPCKIQDIPFTSIDAAKALEYQWLISDTRHSFIRSLGIDSKNILFGDNWNPSLPRFAANLSFNPLKPMKPVQSSGSAAYCNYVLEPIPHNSSETNQTSQISNSTKKEASELDWKSLKTTEQTIDAFKDNNFTIASTASLSIPYVSNEPLTTEAKSLPIFENALSNDDKISKTPPISEMESVTRFSSPLPAEVRDIEVPATQMHLEDNFKNTLSVNEVVVTSTFTGSFKETHIYTPPQSNDLENNHATSPLSTSSSSPTKASPIDFDYEKAAMGVIIDETVVKKEYRDVEYNPPFTMESLSKVSSSKIDMLETNSPVNSNPNILRSTDINVVEDESGDDFSEFQSVSSDVVTLAAAIPKQTMPLGVPKNTTVSHGGMILSPAILIPQAISMQSQKPKIEWGDSTAAINPEELARIEELFPEPKSLKSNGSNSSQKTTPTHQVASTPSISATVANKELEGNLNSNNDDDDDWSDFVSVTLTNNAAVNKVGSNNNILIRSPAASPFQQRSSTAHRIPPTPYSNSNNDDEWSEFVSSVPPLQQPPSYTVPQFNSGAWQNANFYNNPLSMYHKGPMNIPTTTAPSHSAQKYLHNNNNNNYNNISQQPYQIAHNMPPVMLANHQQTPNNTYQQQVHVMQNFSTAPVPTPDRISAAVAASIAKNNQFQSIGSAKVAPSIALIPDLGFVAPAIPTHTSFINSLPKPSINMKK